MAALPPHLKPIDDARVYQQLAMAAALRGQRPATQTPGGAPPPQAAPPPPRPMGVGQVNPAPQPPKPPVDIGAIRAQAKAEAQLEIMHRLHESGALRHPDEMRAAQKPAPKRPESTNQPQNAKNTSPVANRPNPSFVETQRSGGRGGRTEPTDAKTIKKGAGAP